MKDMTVGAFCRKYGACKEGREWAYNLTNKRSKLMMSELWWHLSFGNHLLWVITRQGVMTDKDLRLFACRCVRDTHLSDGRTVWDLLDDERSRNAVVVAERYANGEATTQELSSAWAAASAAAGYAARDAARDAASAAAWAAAGYAAWAAASAAAWAAARAAARAAAWDEQKTFLVNPFTEAAK